MEKKLFYERPKCNVMEVMSDSLLAASNGVGKGNTEDGGDDELSKGTDLWDEDELSNE